MKPLTRGQSAPTGAEELVTNYARQKLELQARAAARKAASSVPPLSNAVAPPKALDGCGRPGAAVLRPSVKLPRPLSSQARSGHAASAEGANPLERDSRRLSGAGLGPRAQAADASRTTSSQRPRSSGGRLGKPQAPGAWRMTYSRAASPGKDGNVSSAPSAPSSRAFSAHQLLRKSAQGVTNGNTGQHAGRALVEPGTPSRNPFLRKIGQRPATPSATVPAVAHNASNTPHTAVTGHDAELAGVLLDEYFTLHGQTAYLSPQRRGLAGTDATPGSTTRDARSLRRKQRSGHTSGPASPSYQYEPQFWESARAVSSRGQPTSSRPEDLDATVSQGRWLAPCVHSSLVDRCCFVPCSVNACLWHVQLRDLSFEAGEDLQELPSLHDHKQQTRPCCGINAAKKPPRRECVHRVPQSDFDKPAVKRPSLDFCQAPILS